MTNARPASDQTGLTKPVTLLTVPEAAQQLGISVEALRSRLRRGQFHTVRRGGRLLVSLTKPVIPLATLVTPLTEVVGQGDQPNQDRLTGQLQHLQGELAHVRELLAREQAERERAVATLEADKAILATALERSQAGEAELRRLLAMQTPALPAPVAEPAPTAPEMTVEAPTVTAPTDMPRRRWWAFWRH